MESLSGLYKGGGMELTITPEGKTYTDIVSPTGQMQALSLSTFFNRAVADGTGSAVLKREEIAIPLRYSLTKNIVELTDNAGGKIVFCFYFGRMYMLDPTGGITTVLSK
jgi:hypothetical protein